MISYLDNSATTRPADAVVEAMAQCMREGYFNPSSLYAPAVQAEKRLAACREAILSSLQAREHFCLFTSGGTEANNLAILGSVAAMRGTPPLAVGTTEHPSVLAPFEHLQSLGYPVQRIPVTSEGEVNYAQFHLAEDTALVSFMQVNNETGALLNVERFAAAVRAMAPNALIHIDGVQGYLRVPLSLKSVDMYTLSGHKLHGPKGIGALVVRKGVRLLPRQMGGELARFALWHRNRPASPGCTPPWGHAPGGPICPAQKRTRCTKPFSPPYPRLCATALLWARRII